MPSVAWCCVLLHDVVLNNITTYMCLDLSCLASFRFALFWFVFVLCCVVLLRVLCFVGFILVSFVFLCLAM